MKKSLAFICALFLFGILNAQYSSTDTTINFDDKVDWDRVDTVTYNTSNLWQVGTPNKTMFTAANSLPNAMVTDLHNAYPVNSNSSFTVGLNGGDNLVFSHKFETEKGKDGLYIECSGDNGLNWFPLPNPECTEACKWTTGSWFYTKVPTFASGDTLYNGNYGFSGSNSSWKKDTLSMCFLAVKTDLQFLVKFTFISDNIADNKAGYMIDDINISYEYQCPGAVNEILQKPLIISPNPFNDITTISISGNQYLRDATLTVKDISGREIYLLNNINDNKIVLEKGNINPGIYFFTLSEKGDVIGQGKVLVH